MMEAKCNVVVHVKAQEGVFYVVNFGYRNLIVSVDVYYREVMENMRVG